MANGENVDAVILRHRSIQCDMAATPLRDNEFAQAPCNGSADQEVALQDRSRIDNFFACHKGKFRPFLFKKFNDSFEVG